MYNLDEMLDRSADTWSKILDWDMEAVSPWTGAAAFVEAKPTEDWNTESTTETWTESATTTQSAEAPVVTTTEAASPSDTVSTIIETAATTAGFESVTEMADAAAEGCPFASKMINDAEDA